MKLVFLQGPDTSQQEVSLSAGQNIAGRDPANAIHLPSRRVSRKHCVFEVAGMQTVVRDLGSSNGVIVEGHRVQQAALTHGQRIQVGDYLLQYQQEETAPAPHLDASPASTPSSGFPPQAPPSGFDNAPPDAPSPFGAPPDQRAWPLVTLETHRQAHLAPLQKTTARLSRLQLSQTPSVIFPVRPKRCLSVLLPAVKRPPLAKLLASPTTVLLAPHLRPHPRNPNLRLALCLLRTITGVLVEAASAAAIKRAFLLLPLRRKRRRHRHPTRMRTPASAPKPSACSTMLFSPSRRSPGPRASADS